MKRILTITALVLLLCATVLSSAACMNRNAQITVDACWERYETLEYSMHDSDFIANPVVGTLRIDLNSYLSDDDKVLSFDGENRTYSSATVRINEKLERINDYRIDTEILAYNYTVLATNKVFTDVKNGGKDSYSLFSYHDGKNYVYTIRYHDGTEKSGKIAVGNSNYTDNEFLYYYVRCYDIGSVPSKTKVADPFADKAYTLACSNVGTVKVGTEITNTDKKIKGIVDCNKVSISFTSNPVGSSINVYYVPEEIEEGDYGLKSRKFPAKIEENNVTFVLKDYSASYYKD